MKLTKNRIEELAEFLERKQIECGDCPLTSEDLSYWIKMFVADYYTEQSLRIMA